MTIPIDFQLATARCRLRAPEEADIPHVFTATRYAGFNDGMLWDPPATEDELREPLVRSHEAWKAGRGFTFTIEAKGDSTFLGRISIRTTEDPKLWDIGFWLHPVQQSRGFMREAAEAIIAFGFERLGAIQACYATWNTRSRRLLESLGMKEVEYLPQGYQKRGEWLPEYRMRVERERNPEPNQRVESNADNAPQNPRGSLST